MAALDERKLIEETIRDLEDGLHKLEEERDMLEWDISKKRDRLQMWRSKLAALSGDTTPGASEQHKRAPRGANLKTILALLQDPASPRQGLSCAEMVAKTSLSFSSVQAALKQGEQASLIEQADGFWRPRQANLPQVEMNGKVN